MSGETGGIVQCGWCPMFLPDDPVEWTHHFLVEHRIDGYSVRHDFAGSDWDVGELVGRAATEGNKKP